MLGRSITGIYLTGREVIEVFSNSELKPHHLEQSRDAVQRLTGLGIIEQTPKGVIIQDFLDPSKFPFENLIKHIFQIISFMQKSLIETLSECELHSVADVSNLENEVDRLYWLTTRQLLQVLIDGTIGDKIGISSLSDAASNHLIIKCLEDIADHYESISITSIDALKKGIQKEDINLQKIVDLSVRNKIIMENILNVLLSEDTFAANQLIDQVEDLLEDMNNFANKLLAGEKNVDFAVNINSILWNLREIARQCRNILETIMNQCLAKIQGIGEKKKKIGEKVIPPIIGI
jgi:phosphate uptake regulator